MIRSRYPAVNTLLHRLDEAQQCVNQTKKVAEHFLANLTRRCDAKDLWVAGSKFVGVGSSYEGTAVSCASDFDVALVLAPPMSTDNFKIIEVSEIGLFKLEYKNRDKGALKDFINDNDYLKVKEFRNCIFRELDSVVGTITVPGYTIKPIHNDYESVCSFKVQLQEDLTNKKLDFDIVPMIEAECDLPRFNLSALPSELQSYVKRHDSYAMFSLAPPPRLGENYKHLVVQTAFGLLEQEAMKIALLRDSVLVTKYVAKERKWSDIGIKSFHIKRVAIALCQDIQKTNDPWNGYLIICDNLCAMLKNNIIRGVFLKEQNIYIQDTSTPEGVPSVAQQLRQKCLEMETLQKEI